MTCKTCKHWDIERARDKAGRVRADRVARCKWVSKEVWPASTWGMTRPHASHMRGADGADCGCYEERE